MDWLDRLPIFFAHATEIRPSRQIAFNLSVYT
jgi:hypothetical protein